MILLTLFIIIRNATPSSNLKNILKSSSKEDLCKLNRVASQPHVQALLPSAADKDNHHHHHARSSSIPIKKSNTRVSPIPSPSDYSSSFPKSFERPKSIILTMDAIKNKNARLPEPVELGLLSNDKQTGDADNREYFEDVSSGKCSYIACTSNWY